MAPSRRQSPDSHSGAAPLSVADDPPRSIVGGGSDESSPGAPTPSPANALQLNPDPSARYNFSHLRGLSPVDLFDLQMTSLRNMIATAPERIRVNIPLPLPRSKVAILKIVSGILQDITRESAGNRPEGDDIVNRNALRDLLQMNGHDVRSMATSNLAKLVGIMKQSLSADEELDPREFDETDPLDIITTVMSWKDTAAELLIARNASISASRAASASILRANPVNPLLTNADSDEEERPRRKRSGANSSVRFNTQPIIVQDSSDGEKDFSFALGESRPVLPRDLGDYPGILYSKPSLVVTESLGPTILHV